MNASRLTAPPEPSAPPPPASAALLPRACSMPAHAPLIVPGSLDAAFAGLNGQSGAHSWQANLRRDRNSQFGGSSTGFAGYAYRIGGGWRVHASHGTSFVAPNFNQLYYPGFSNPLLQPERGRNTEAALSWSAGGHDLRLTRFDNRIRGYIKAKDIEFQPVSLQQVCTNVTHLMNDWLRSEQIGLEIQITEQDLWVQGDPVQLSQILFNLLRNAGQACSHQPQPRITLRLYTEGDHAMVQVQDNGSGFSPQALLNDTQQFVSTKIDGLGVGLSISSHIAELHHGSLSLNNAPEGGAQVTVSLPLSLPLRPTAA